MTTHQALHQALHNQNKLLLESEQKVVKLEAQLEQAEEIIRGLMRFCRCFAQHHTEDIRYKEAEQFLQEVPKWYA